MTKFGPSLLVALLLITTSTRAEDPLDSGFLVNNWRTEEGLPHSIINAIVQTHDGYLWIATYVGLVRFDGARFVHYSAAEVRELQDGRISALFVDREDTLWIGLETGRVVAWKEGIPRIHLPGGTNQSPPIVSFAQDQSGTIWCQSVDGQLGRLTATGIQFIARNGQSLGRSSLSLVVDAQDELWVGTRDGLKLWRDGQLVTPPGLESLAGRTPDVFAPARDGSVWMYRDRQLWKLRVGGILAHFDAPELLTDFVNGILEAADGCVWLAASDGSLFRLETSGQWKTIPATNLRGSNRALYEDREGNIWRGSFGGGLTRIRSRVFAAYELPEAMLDRYALTVCADPATGDIWGLLNNHTMAHIPMGAKTADIIIDPAFPRTIRSLCYDRRNSLWGGGDNGEIFRFRDGKFSLEMKIDEPIEYISAMFEDSRSNLWVGYGGGSGVGILPDGDPARWQTLPGVPFPAVRSIAQGADGAMWFGTHYGGVLRWQDEKWTQFRQGDGLSSDYVRAIHADPDGTMWFGTLRGVTRWRAGKFVAIRKENGLWNESISHIADDGRGNFWMSSFGGVFRVQRQDMNDFADGKRESVPCVGYNRNDGLIGLECPGGFQPAGARTPDGRLWFPTINGLISVAPADIKANDLPPPVWIEEVTVDGIPNPIRHATRELSIPPGKRRFDFHFTALSLSSPEKVRFRHKLEGLDLDWSRPDDQRTIIYSYIPPGHYTLKVIACNNDGVWSPEGSSLAVIIQPFFWQTWWFKSGLAALLMVGIAFSARRLESWNTRLRLERLEQQHAVERERSRIAKDIHDDLGANLTQIVFLSQRAETTSHDEHEVERWLRLIPAVARRTIQSLDEIVWAINPKHDSLESLANYLSQFATEHLGLAKIRCILDVPTVLPQLELNAELRHNLVLAAREAVQNIVAHAAASEVRVALQLDDDSLSITLADNGRGFDLKRLPPDGNGLPNMRRRLEDIGGRTEIASQPGSGTTVRLVVPRSRLHGRVIGEAGPNGSQL